MTMTTGVKTRVLAAAVLGLAGGADAQTVPMDAQGGCPIAPAAVAGMFVGNAVSLNGVVKAADSTQVLAPNCGFFKWTEQMFLWLTSPAPASYGGGGGRIMFSPKFFTVTPEDAGGRRTFIANRRGGVINMVLRKTELGPHGLPALISRSGHVVEVARPVPGRPVPPLIRGEGGQLVRLSAVKRDESGALHLFGMRGAEVQARKLDLPVIVRQRVMLEPGVATAMVPMAAFKTAIQANKFVLNNIPVFVDLSGNVIDVEPGQADGGVLLSQNNSLIYYISAVNDVYAYHRTMKGAAVIPFGTSITFPMTAADGAAVAAFAAGKGHTIPEPNALAIETKSSWIDAGAVANPGDYISVRAVVPTFNKANPNMWVPNGQTTLKVIMVGIHVVGSTNGHGEMVWGSFEHFGNAPDAAYTYNSTTGPKTVAQNTAGTWTFTPSGASSGFNVTHASVSGANIVGTPVASTPVLRTKPWGTDGTNASLNTQVISANASVLSQLVAGDVRKNYFQIGTTWTIGGAAPNGGNEVGTSQLANATIETFVQASSPGAPGSNCFACHNTNKVAVSHIYRELQPLP